LARFSTVDEQKPLKSGVARYCYTSLYMEVKSLVFEEEEEWEEGEEEEWEEEEW
jgi:hypothetical protein